MHLPAFAAAVDAGVAAIMPAFTELGGIPMTMHKELLRDYLRGELGFDGVIVSDYNAIRELIHHGVAGDIVVALTAPEEIADTGIGLADGCVKDQAKSVLRDIKRNPDQYYVNVHTTDFPGGAVRGQLALA